MVGSLLALIIAAVVLCAAAALRGGEYDEAYTAFLANGTPRPDWPTTPFRAGDAISATHVGTTAAAIAGNLRSGDVHPPLYFWAAWAWREAAGPSLFATRLLSVISALAALALVGAIACTRAIPPMPAMLLCLGSYGFTYTGTIARGFALAQLLNLLGAWAVLRTRHPAAALAAGTAFGAAAFANYLAVFTAGAFLLWLLVTRAWRRAAGLALGMVPFLAGSAWFFLAQRGSRQGQFPPFEFLPSLVRLAQYQAAALLGGLPLYAGTARPFLAALLALLCAALAMLILYRVRRLPPPLLLATVATPAGLLALGFVFNTTPIELRYLAFSAPFVALLLAAVLTPRLCALILAVQAAAIAGMLIRPETMQPQAQAALDAASLAGPDGLVLLPRGNDGVGVAGAFLLAAPAGMRAMIITTAPDPATITAPRAVLVLLSLDRDSRATSAALDAAFAASPLWRPAGEAANLRVYDRTGGTPWPVSSTASN